MELIRKTIKLKDDVTNSFVILLTSTVKDLGFFDSATVYGYTYAYLFDDSYNGIGLENLE